MCMLERRLQILIDDRRYKRLLAYARQRNLSVGAAVREAIDQVVPAATPKREAAAIAILEAPRMRLGDPAELRRELDELRARRA